MARHEYTPGQDGAYSAEIYRLQMEQIRRDEERKKALAELNEYRKPVEQAVHTAEKMLERQVRKAVTSDPLANEFRNASIYGGFVASIAGGIALSVAAAAAEAANNRALERARDDLTSQQHNDYDNAYQERQVEQTKSLADYKSEVAERAQMLESSTTAYYNEYKAVKDEATAAIAAENDMHEKRMREYDKQEREADNLAKADRARADEAYQSKLSEIEKLPASERREATREAERERDATYRDIDDRHNSTLSTINENRDSSIAIRDKVVEHQNELINTAKQNYSDEIKAQKNFLSNAEANLTDFESARDEVRDRSAAIKDSKIMDGYTSKYDSARHFTDDEMKLIDKVQADDEARKLARKTGTEYTPLVSDEERRQAHDLQREHRYNSSDRASAYEFTSAVNKTHTEVGHSLAATLGSAREKELLQKVADDDKARRAAENGGKPYVPTVTNAERAEAKAIEKQYAGSLSSKKDIDNSIAKLGQASKSLDVQINQKTSELNTHKSNLEKINNSISSKQQQLGEINMANKALRTGKDENGAPLSAAKRAQLESTVKNGPSATQLQKDINGLKQNKNAALDQIKKSNEGLKGLQQTKAQTDNHIGMLQRNKGAIADTGFDITKQKTFTGALKGMAADKANQVKDATSKKINNAIVAKGNSLRDNKTGLVALGGAAAAHMGRKNLEKMDKKSLQKAKSKTAEKLQGKAGKMMKSSMKNIQREANRAIHQGNAVHKELFGTARKLSRVAQKYELALSVAAISLKVVKMPAAFAAKCGRHAFRHIGGHTALGRKLAEARMKRLAKIDAWKNGHKGLMTAAHLGKLAGKGAVKSVLHAPTKLLNAPRAIIGTLTDPTILAKKAAAGAFRVTRKTTGLALKGANKAVRFGGKMGRKAFNKTLGRTKLFKKMSAGRANLLNKLKMSRLGRMFGGAKKKLLNFSALLKKLRMKIAAWLASAFSSLLSALFTVLGYAMLGAIFILIAYVTIMICSGVLTGVFNAIMNWLKSLTTEHKALVKNNPEFLMNCAVEYRNAELEILDMVRTGQTNPGSLPISSDPLLGGLSPLFNNFNAGLDLQFNERKNPQAQNNLNSILARFDVKEKDSQDRVTKEYKYTGSRTINTNFDYLNSKYNTINIQYYTSEYLQRDDNGRTKAALVANAVASPYEVSNAKDALAIIDSLYTEKMETMQKMEALAYMGVGATQLGSFTNENQRGGSLFWNTHKIIYRNGTKPADVWYHTTSVPATGNASVDGAYMYSNASGTAKKAATDTSCDNQKTMTLNYTEYRYSYSKRHTNASTWDNTAYSASVREYKTDNAISKIKHVSSSNNMIVPAAMYYNLNNTTATSVTQSYSFANGNGTTTTDSITFYVTKTNYDTGKSLNSYHYSANCNILKFYKLKGYNYTYAITDKDGYYIGTYYASNGSALQKLISQVKVNPSDGGSTTINNYSDNAAYWLDYFWLKWDAAQNCYGFNIITTESTDFFKKDSRSLDEMQGAIGWGYTTVIVDNVVDYLDTTKINLVSCSHTDTTTTTIPHTTTLKVCMGHIDLDVAIGVISGCERSDGNENNDMFMEAMYVEGLEEDTTNSGFLGIYVKDKENEVSGWGSITYKAFHPDEDWAPKSELRQAARLKTRNTLTYGAAGVDIKYQCDDDDCINCVHHDNGTTGGRTKFQTLRVMPTDEMGFGFVFAGKVFYQTSMVSGEQRNIDCYLYSGGSFTKKNIDLLVPEGSAPSIRYNTPR